MTLDRLLAFAGDHLMLSLALAGLTLALVYTEISRRLSGYKPVNPAGLTQHGVPLHDAIKAMPFPVIEVHMSNIAAREAWRAHSIISPAVRGTVQGLGWRSYTAALRALAELAAETAAGAAGS